MRHESGEPIDRRLGQPERLAHLAHRGAPAVAHDVGHHGGAVAAVLAVDVLDHLLAAGVHDVEVDVRRLVPLARQEPLEQQLDPRRIDGRDPQAVADHRVGGRAAPLAEDALLPAVPDDLPHRQEIAAVVELVDQRQLPVDLLADGHGHVVAEALARAAERELAQPRGRRPAVGQPLGRIAVADLGQVEGAARRHLAGPLDERRLVGEQLRHPLRRLQIVLGVRPDQPAGGGERDAVADAGQDVLQVAARRRVVQHLGGGDQGQAGAPGMPAQAGFPAHFLGAPVPCRQRVQPVAERLPQRPGDRARLRAPDQQAPIAAPERNEPPGPLAHLRPGDARLPFRPPPAAGGDQPAEVGVAGPIRREQHAGGKLRRVTGRRDGRGVRCSVDGHLGADDQAHAQLLRLHVRPHHAVHAVAVGQGERLDPERMRLLDQLVGVTRPVEKREVAPAPERDVHHSTRPCQHHRRRGRS